MTAATLARAALTGIVTVALLPVTIPIAAVVTAERVRVHWRRERARKRRLAAIRSLDCAAHSTGPRTWGAGWPERDA